MYCCNKIYLLNARTFWGSNLLLVLQSGNCQILTLQSVGKVYLYGANQVVWAVWHTL